MNCCDQFLRFGELADGLDKLTVVGLWVKQDSVDNVAIVIADRDERDGIVSAPVGHGQGEVALFVFSVGKSTKETSDLGVEMVLKIPAGAYVDGALKALGFGVFCDGILLYQGVRPNFSL